MKLSECEVLPGIVIDVEDPKHIGRVKAMVPTWFDTDVMEKEALPWVWPCGMPGYQRFSKLENGRKIWVLHNKENDLEYWYWPMFEETEGTKQIVDQYDSTEVLLSRTCGEGSIYIYYNDSEGIVAKIGETKINITSNNEIHITDSKASVKIVGGQIFIGKDDNQELTVMGETLQKALIDLGQKITNLGTKMGGGQYICEVAPDVLSMGQEFTSKCQEILSETVKVSK